MVLQKNNHHPPQPRGIIFDCDGTLADTMPLHWRAWQVIAARHGFSLPRRPFLFPRRRAVAGHPEAVERGARRCRSIRWRWRGRRRRSICPLIAQVEPINTVVGVARENYGKIPLAVASGGTKKNHRASARPPGHPALVPGSRHQRRRREPEAGAGHLPGGRPPPRRAAAVLPRLRGYGFGDARRFGRRAWRRWM